MTTSRLAEAATRLVLLAALGAMAACAHGKQSSTAASSGATAASVEAVPVPPTADPSASRHFLPPPLGNDAIAARMAELRERLSLDADQQAEVRAILADSHARYEVLRRQAEDAGGVQDPALRAQFVQLHFDTEDRIYGVLRCDQKDELRTLEREERMARIEHYRATRRLESETTQVLPAP